MCTNFIMAGVHFIILKINGIDVCHLPHEDAVQMFLSASDPILIEVCRERDQPFIKESDNNDSNLNNSRRTKTALTNNGEITAAATTKALLTPTNRKKVNSASNVTLMGSIQQNTANTALKKKLTLYIPPPPPVYLSIGNIDIDNENENLKLSYARQNSNTGDKAPSLYENDEDAVPVPGHDYIPTAQPKFVSTAIQTDVNDFVSLFHVANAATTDQIIEQEHNLFEACLAPDIGIEEITLRKSDSNEHLGLTVCYSQTVGSSSGNTNSNNSNVNTEDTNDSCSEVYISDIQPNSIAGRDGRLRQGDQILQVNGKDVTNKKETETLIAENNNAVTLLVSRYLYADEDDFNDTCVAGLDIEDEDEEDDEDDDDEYFDENNLAYENCLITSNECIPPSKVVLDAVVVTAPTSSSVSAATATKTAAKIEESHSRNIATSSGAISTVTSTATMITATASPTKIQQQTGKNKTSNRTQVFLKYDPLNHQNIKAHLKQVNQELALLDSRMENLMAKSLPPAAASNDVEYDTEHIYETIPEDSESEPFYCSPYESSIAKSGNVLAYTSLESAHLQQQKQRVAAWLGMQSSTQRQHILNTNMRGGSVLNHLPPHVNSLHENAIGVGTIVTTSSRSKSGTMRSAATNATTGTTGSSSSGGCGSGGGVCGGNSVACLNEHENSSSAYNTGGSNNSGAALTLVLNPPVQHDLEQLAALRLSKGQRLLSPKDKLTSPRHQSSPTAVTQFVTKVLTCATGVQRVVPPITNCTEFQAPLPATRNSQQTLTTTTTTANSAATINSHQQFSSSTMYTNVANLQQTMLLQQQLFRQALTQQQQQSHYLSLQKQQQEQQISSSQQNLHTMHTCPQFTAPNLSQYHFVSSQEVSAEQIRVAAAAAAAKTSNEEPMVWKVKRRQDGTRYIVRRPARTRMLRDRALRINAERENHHELTTTEDDTISEIKTGRYWTREERKKHIERARDRRQQQQQQLATTMRITEKPEINTTEPPAANTVAINTKIFKEKQPPIAQQQLNKIQQRTNTSNLQHHQLQFGSITQQTPDICTTATKLMACNNNSINSNTKQQKQLSANKNNSGGNKITLQEGVTVNINSVNADTVTVIGDATSTPLSITATSLPVTTTTAVTKTSTVNSAGTINGAIGAGAQQQSVGAVQGTTTVSNGNKLVGLLSVTTV